MQRRFLNCTGYRVSNSRVTADGRGLFKEQFYGRTAKNLMMHRVRDSEHDPRVVRCFQRNAPKRGTDFDE
jgi:hypothetical protein